MDILFIVLGIFTLINGFKLKQNKDLEKYTDFAKYKEFANREEYTQLYVRNYLILGCMQILVGSFGIADNYLELPTKVGLSVVTVFLVIAIAWLYYFLKKKKSIINK